VFSLAGAMRSPRKNRLNAESIQVCQCLRSWHIGSLSMTYSLDCKRPDTGKDVEEVQVFDRARGRHGGAGAGGRGRQGEVEGGGGGGRLSRTERA